MPVHRKACRACSATCLTAHRHGAGMIGSERLHGHRNNVLFSINQSGLMLTMCEKDIQRSLSTRRLFSDIVKLFCDPQSEALPGHAEFSKAPPLKYHSSKPPY